MVACFKSAERCVEDEISDVRSIGRRSGIFHLMELLSPTLVSHRQTESCHSKICLAEELGLEFLHRPVPSRHLWKAVLFSFHDWPALRSVVTQTGL